MDISHAGVNKSPTVTEGGEAIEALIVPGSEMLALMLTAFLTCLLHVYWSRD